MQARNAGSREFTPLTIGQEAWLKHHITGKWDQQVQVLERRQNGQSYVVKTKEGKLYTRGRRLLKPTSEQKLERNGIPKSGARKPTPKADLYPLRRLQPPRKAKMSANIDQVRGYPNIETVNLVITLNNVSGRTSAIEDRSHGQSPNRGQPNISHAVNRFPPTGNQWSQHHPLIGIILGILGVITAIFLCWLGKYGACKGSQREVERQVQGLADRRRRREELLSLIHI